LQQPSLQELEVHFISIIPTMDRGYNVGNNRSIGYQQNDGGHDRKHKLAGDKWPWPEISLGAWKRLGNQRSKK